jgi:hypothetical protein
MTRRLALTVPFFVALMSGAAPSAQQAPEKPTTANKPKEVRVDVTRKAPANVERIEERVKVPPGPNVRVELTLTDQQTGAPTTSKTVMLTTSNHNWGRLRTQISSRIYGTAPLNIDARPTVTEDGRVSLELTIEYSQGRNSESENNVDKVYQVGINQSLTALLDNGKPLLVTQSADPISDRKVTVEVKTTIVR